MTLTLAIAAFFENVTLYLAIVRTCNINISQCDLILGNFHFSQMQHQFSQCLEMVTLYCTMWLETDIQRHEGSK